MPQSPCIRLAVRQLAEFLLRTGSIDSRFAGFDRALEGARIHRRLQKEAGEGYEAEVPLRAERMLEGVCYLLEGRADGIFTLPDGCVAVDEIKTTTQPSAGITEDGNPCHWAQGMLYAAILAGERGLAEAAVRLTYYQTDEQTLLRFTRRFTRAQLEEHLQGLLRQYAPWAQRQLQWQARRRQSLQALRFPFAQYRPGQRALAGEIYRACRPDAPGPGAPARRIFCQAPTGTGKTMSALFPALKAIADTPEAKIFYLTARGTAQAAAGQALHTLRSAHPGLAVRSVTLAAKEKCCLCKNEEGRPECLPGRCPYADGYYSRVKDALAFLLDGGGACGREALEQAAHAYSVCPFELGLDLSGWCDVIVGDYNYLFDPTVRLRRFFDAQGDWVFLIDEAHNLPGRAREMYSAHFDTGALAQARRALGKGRGGLKSLLGRAARELAAARRACAALLAAAGEPPAQAAPGSAAPPESGGGQEPAQQSLLPQSPEVEAPAPAFAAALEQAEVLWAAGGAVFLRKLPPALLRPLQMLAAPLQQWLQTHEQHPAHAQLLELCFALRDLAAAAERYDSHFVTQLTVRGGALGIALLCLDPAPFVDAALARGRAAALFSATLTPPGYYRSVLGCEQARAVSLNSPFPPGNLGLYCLPGISTRYREREASVRPIADALAALVRGKVGNYMAFFPSYAYLQQVQQALAAHYPDIPLLAQQSGADEAARAAFLARFAPAPQTSLLGLGVLGGVFGEGVDLVGERLIGCAVVGVGLPQVNPRQEMLRRYFEQTRGAGFDYAYRYPGMNKVLQAAGRVIRTENDRGVVLLIDSRFAQPQTRRLFPAHWAGIQYLQSAGQLAGRLALFWAQGG